MYAVLSRLEEKAQSIWCSIFCFIFIVARTSFLNPARYSYTETTYKVCIAQGKEKTHAGLYVAGHVIFQNINILYQVLYNADVILGSCSGYPSRFSSCVYQEATVLLPLEKDPNNSYFLAHKAPSASSKTHSTLLTYETNPLTLTNVSKI